MCFFYVVVGLMAKLLYLDDGLSYIREKLELLSLLFIYYKLNTSPWLKMK